MPPELQQHVEPHVPHAEPSVTTWPPNLRRRDASRYLQTVYGIVVQPSTLAKWHCLRSDGPAAYHAGRTPLYPRARARRLGHPKAWTIAPFYKRTALNLKPVPRDVSQLPPPPARPRGGREMLSATACRPGSRCRSRPSSTSGLCPGRTTGHPRCRRHAPGRRRLRRQVSKADKVICSAATRAAGDTRHQPAKTKRPRRAWRGRRAGDRERGAYNV